MTGWFNTVNFSATQMTQLRFSLATYSTQDPASAMMALNQLNMISQRDALLTQSYGQFSQFGGFQMPHCGCIPQPQMQMAGAPAGRGLSTNPEGWPAGSVKTAGGYTVVPEGNTNWSIYGPNQKQGEKPMTRVWGDPHVDEKDGTRWDFTKNSDFLLPDGTRIAVNTSSQTGQSVSTGLNITNGADRVEVSNVNGAPKTSGVTHDGYEWRSQHIAQNPGADTFRLGGNGDSDVRWYRERNGQVDGLVTGAHYDHTTNRYEQKIDKGSQYYVDPNLRPPYGSAAWGNQLRSEVNDQIAQLPIPNGYKQLIAGYIANDHLRNEAIYGLGFNPFGGLMNAFPSWGQATGAVGGLGDLMMLQQMQMQTLGMFRSSNVWA